MNWTMVGALGEFFGALAVVASLLYVGHQVRQNNRIARAEAYRDVTLSWARMLHLWADDEAAAKVFMDHTGVRLADVPEDVRNAYLLRHAAMIRVFETIYRQVSEGVLDVGALDLLPRSSSPLFHDSWMALRESYSVDFRSFFESRFRFGDETTSP
jgi:hypothetical protein